MKVYNKKQLPSWMMMNDPPGKHWMTSGDVDMELSPNPKWADFANKDLSDMDRIKLRQLRTKCSYAPYWKGEVESVFKCNETAMTKPELQTRHATCEGIADASSAFTSRSYDYGCNMYNNKGIIFPEYKHCLTKDGLAKNYDCQLACYVYPNQKGCETVASMTLAQRKKEFEDKKKGIYAEQACKTGQLEYSREDDFATGLYTNKDLDCKLNALIRPELKLRQKKCKQQPTQQNCSMYYTNPNKTQTLYPEYTNCTKPGADMRPECQFACFANPGQKGCELVKQISVPGTVLVYDRPNNTVRVKFTTPDKKIRTATMGVAGVYSVNQPISVVISAKSPYTVAGVKRL